MSRGLLALIIFTIIILCFALLFMFICWFDSKGNTPKIKFSSFKKFYAINPYRWNLYDDSVSCRIDNPFGTISTHFGFIDFYRYKLWRNSLDKKNQDKKYAKDMSIIIANVKRDIANTERIAKQKYEQAEDIMDQITALG